MYFYSEIGRLKPRGELVTLICTQNPTIEIYQGTLQLKDFTYWPICFIMNMQNMAKCFVKIFFVIYMRNKHI